jgi:hypothetical protein
MRLVCVLIIALFILEGCTLVEVNQGKNGPSSEFFDKEIVNDQLMSNQPSKIKTSPESSNNPEVINNDQSLTSSPIPEVKKILKIGWDFEKFYDEKSFDTPITKVYLIIEGDLTEREYIGEYTGVLDYYNSETDSWGFPESSIITCLGWYAGAGDLLAVVREEPGLLTVKHKYVAEPGGDPEIEKALDELTFKNVKSIEIDEDSQIQAFNNSEE